MSELIKEQIDSIKQEVSGTEYEELIELIDFDKIKFSDCDTNQLYIKLSEDIYLFSQADFVCPESEKKSEYRTEILDFNDYSREEHACAIYGYYDSLEKVHELYKKDAKMIILECSFENI